jgi:hypothetical protein
MNKKIKITLLFLFIASLAGLSLRMASIGFPLLKYKNLLNTHSHIALLGWLYNASLILLQYSIFPKSTLRFTSIFWISQLTFLGMLFSFPFQGYGLYSIIFSTLYLFSSYYVAYQLIIKSKEYLTPIVAQFVKWSAIYLIISSFGPFSLGYIMVNGLKDSFLYNLSIYWFLHFLYNGFFIFILFAYIINKQNNTIEFSRVFRWMNLSVIPLYALSILWLKPSEWFYFLGSFAATLQIIAYILMVKKVKWTTLFTNKWSKYLVILAFISYSLKLIFQEFAIIPSVQDFIFSTISYSLIGFIHLVMLGFFTLFILSAFIENSFLIMSRLLKIGLSFLVLGIFLSESLLFSQSLLSYFKGESIDNYHTLLFWSSMLMPIGILMIVWGKLFVKNSILRST